MPDADVLRSLVCEAYSAAALAPRDRHPFPVGRAFAEDAGYPPAWLDTLPPASVEAFTGVSNVSQFAEIPAGSAVLDLGCGAGLDTFIAARRAGPAGTAIGLDFSAPMLARARQSAAQAGTASLLFARADGERLPLRHASIDVAMVNGIFNLNPARDAIFAELARVLRPGGRVFAAELILASPDCAPAHNPANWFA